MFPPSVVAIVQVNCLLLRDSTLHTFYVSRRCGRKNANNANNNNNNNNNNKFVKCIIIIIIIIIINVVLAYNIAVNVEKI
jgi:hypothetical protein